MVSKLPQIHAEAKARGASFRGPTNFQQALALILIYLRLTTRPDISVGAILVVLFAHFLLGGILVAAMVLYEGLKTRKAPTP